MLIQQNWQALKPLLAQYQIQPNRDEILIRYAQGALARAEKDYPQAVKLYQQITVDNPNLIYPQFDLGVMLFENKQYLQAEQTLKQVQPYLSVEMQKLTDRYLQAIEQAQGWQMDFRLQYIQTDNVNNASSQREIQLGGMTFIKEEGSLPQKATGFRYGIGASKETNLSGHYFLTLNGDIGGVHYWDNQDYNEKSLYFSTGLKYRSYIHTASISPFWEQNWLGSARYSQNYGVNIAYSRELSDKFSLSNRFTHTQKRYKDKNTAARYDGYLNGLNSTLYYYLNPNITLFVGADFQREINRDKAESSNKWGGNIGTILRAKQIGLRLSGGYFKRHFRANNFYTQNQYKRLDKERQFNASIWHEKLQWKGFVPKLNYKYRRIDSNIPQFYARQNSEWFMTVEKVF
ncbi:hypothetical protein CVP05_07730 [Conservatibacter flavescens]|uniref:DUF560 domain-containing protein n=2 Tax=Conservatibacter flavescens TaxID=28161 RepID=A0A2M8S274_9PAST|nr:hypothetical protein CVP05_07730 [Conservatibacter flavescens]